MPKRICSFLLILVLTLSLAVSVSAEEDLAVAVTAPEELALLAQSPDGSFYLDADLDMSGIDWVPIAFSGKLDGRGHTIFNLNVTSVGQAHAETVDGNAKKYDSVFAGLFSTLIDAQIKDLTLQGVDIQVESETNCFVGGIAGYVHNASISNCSVLDARLTLVAACTQAGDERASRNAGVAGIAGFGQAEITGCTADVTLVFADHCESTIKCEEFMGGIFACGNSLLSGCSVSIQGYDECRGYAHNGGLVGMVYLYDQSAAVRPISGCRVDGSITFFEDNYDRRAYCQQFVGELLTWTNVTDCAANFIGNELFDYTAVLRPEKCEQPQLTETVHEASCTEAGYTQHTCSVCGNTWRDSFVPVTHVPGQWEITQEATYEESGLKSLRCSLCGQIIRQEVIAPHVQGEWTVVRKADYNVEGLEQLLCADCGAMLEERTEPALIPVSRITLEPTELTMYFKDRAARRWTLSPADAKLPIVYFSSSDPSVVSVDTDGTVHALGKGTATVTCVSADGFAESQCVVTVKLTLMQWIRHYIFFGWVIKH